MKKLASTIVLALTILGLATVPAFAAVHVAAHATAHVAQGHTVKVVFTAYTSRRGVVRVTLYRNARAVRTVRATRTSHHRYRASWNLRSSSGALVEQGTYAYKVYARTSTGHHGSTTGVVTVTPPASTTPTTSTGTSTSTSNSGGSTTTSGGSTTATGRWFGMYVPGAPVDMSYFNSLESEFGVHAKVINFFQSDWDAFPMTRARNAAANGSIPLVTLEFGRYVSADGVDAILNGQDDAYLRDFAADAKTFGGEVWLRPLHEMNGNWYGWGGTVNGNTPAKVVAAWKHVHDVIRGAGATNVKFVWCVNCASVPNTTDNAIEKYWPGDSYVDYTAIDGYNWGAHASWSSWQTGPQIFGNAYNRINALTSKPMFIAETACTSNGGDKATWIINFFSGIKTQLPKIQGVCWFNIQKEEDWRLEENASTIAAIKRVASTGF